MPTRIVLALALAVLAAPARGAGPIPPGGIPDFVDARSLGLSASLATAVGNDGLYLNPGAIAARKRYAIEGVGFADRRGGTNVAQFLGGSVVDSQTAPVSAGFSYLRSMEGPYQGNLFHLAFAGPLANDVFLGVGGKWLGLHGVGKVQAATADAGALWQVAPMIAVGSAGYNLVAISNDLAAPMGAGAGIALGSDRSFQVTADWRADFDRRGSTTNRYSAGVEALLGRLVPVRAGWTKDETLETSWWSAGIGLVNPSGAIDVGYRQSIDDRSARTVVGSVKLFVGQ